MHCRGEMWDGIVVLCMVCTWRVLQQNDGACSGGDVTQAPGKACSVGVATWRTNIGNYNGWQIKRGRGGVLAFVRMECYGGA